MSLFSMLHIFPFPTDVFVQCYHWRIFDCGLICPCSLGCFSMISQRFPSPPKQSPGQPCRPLPSCCFPQGSFAGNSSGLLQSWAMAGNGRQSWTNWSLLPWGLLCLPKTAFQLSKAAADPHCRIICSYLRAVHLFRGCKHCQQGFDRSEKWI